MMISSRTSKPSLHRRAVLRKAVVALLATGFAPFPLIGSIEQRASALGPDFTFIIKGVFLVADGTKPAVKTFPVRGKGAVPTATTEKPVYKPLLGNVALIITWSPRIKAQISAVVATSNGLSIRTAVAGNTVALNIWEGIERTFDLRVEYKDGSSDNHSLRLPGSVDWEKWQDLPVNWAALGCLDQVEAAVSRRPPVWPGFDYKPDVAFLMVSLSSTTYPAMLVLPKGFNTRFRNLLNSTPEGFYRGAKWGRWGKQYDVYMVDPDTSTRLVNLRDSQKGTALYGALSKIDGQHVIFVFSELLPSIELAEQFGGEIAAEACDTIAHEMFHIFQSRTFGPAFAESAKKSHPLVEAVGTSRYFEESVLALLDAVNAREAAKRKQALNIYFDKRKAALSRLNPEQQMQVRQREHIEGTATYVGVRVKELVLGKQLPVEIKINREFGMFDTERVTAQLAAWA